MDKSRETFMIKGELHYVLPMTLLNGNTTKCGQCVYFKEHAKPSRYYDGECTSVVRNTERGYTHRPYGNDFTIKNGTACRWFVAGQDTDEEKQLSFNDIMKG